MSLGFVVGHWSEELDDFTGEWQDLGFMYHAFSKFRNQIAQVAGLVNPNENMYEDNVVFSRVAHSGSKFLPLLIRSDCDGELNMHEIYQLEEAFKNLRKSETFEAQDRNFKSQVHGFIEMLNEAISVDEPIQFV
jgi:hypothetical protein